MKLFLFHFILLSILFSNWTFQSPVPHPVSPVHDKDVSIKEESSHVREKRFLPLLVLGFISMGAVAGGSYGIYESEKVKAEKEELQRLIRESQRNRR
ncbi:hypothetical protein HMI54_013597 [Coelomomyces lativittatus]|nr:hypothetical protein HMI56_005037 [Coelomomyces lativittatus]KAJ1514773.1 hypothetical protein HMI54_013597 [Coelomomyces lativittatus]KAJ1516960.1 hypothetical protein HMI55_000977 [Coelomomyces lativittatus]